MPGLPVPRGERLVIEYVSFVATHLLLNAAVTTSVNGTTVSYPLPATATSNGSAFAQQMRLYADGGTTVSVSMTGAEYATVSGGLSGQLEPAS